MLALILASSMAIANVAARISTASAYYNMPGFDVPTMPYNTLSLDKLNWNTIDQVLYYVVTPDAQGGTATGISSESATQLVTAAHTNSKLAGVVVGGFNGTLNMASFITTDANRQSLAQSLVDLVQMYNFDTLEFDWIFSAETVAQDAANLALLFPAIRKINPELPLGMTLGWSAARSDVSSLSQYLDWGDLLAFYWWNPYNATSTGAVSPTVTCEQELYNGPTGPSVEGLIAQWVASGFPAEKMVLGFAPSAYNYSGIATISTAADSDTSLFQPAALNLENTAGVTSTSALISAGVLAANAEDGVGSYKRFWDSCTKTPYLISQDDAALISYEDPASIAAKVDLARNAGFAGVSLYGAADDAPGQVLLQVARKTIQGDSDNGTFPGHGWIALWIFLPIFVLSTAGALFFYRRRKVNRARALKQTPAMVEIGHKDGSPGSSINEKSEKFWCVFF